MHVSACYQSVPLKLAMSLLVIKMSVKSFTNERPLEYLPPKSPILPPNIPMLVNKVSRYILVLICFLIATEVTKLSWNNPGLFTWPGGKLLKVGCTYAPQMKCNQTTCSKGCPSNTLWCFTCTLFFNKAMINTLIVPNPKNDIFHPLLPHQYIPANAESKHLHPLMTSLNVS